MKKQTYSRSVAKYIRREKARIRKKAVNKEEAKETIKQLLESLKDSQK